MKKFALLLAGLFVEVIALVGYLISASLFPFGLGVCIFGAIFSVGVIFILITILGKFGKPLAFGISMALAGLLVTAYQILAFSIYPGLAKDLNFFSQEHVIQITILLGISLSIHAILYLVSASILKMRIVMK